MCCLVQVKAHGGKMRANEQRNAQKAQRAGKSAQEAAEGGRQTGVKRTFAVGMSFGALHACAGKVVTCQTLE